jgi:hypothetical protein
MPSFRPGALALSLVFTAALLLTAASASSGPAEADWNARGIRWYGFEDGMEQIERTGLPGVLIFYTDWCPHCTTYSGVFHDRDIVRLSRSFVMIRVNRDATEQLDEQYSARGSYVPRTLFVDPRGDVDWDVAGSHARYPHFLDTSDPRELASLMRRFAAAS